MPETENAKDRSPTSGIMLTLKAVVCMSVLSKNEFTSENEFINPPNCGFLVQYRFGIPFCFAPCSLFAMEPKLKWASSQQRPEYFVSKDAFYFIFFSLGAQAWQANKHECDSTSESINTPRQAHFH